MTFHMADNKMMDFGRLRSAALTGRACFTSRAKPAAAIAECPHDWALFANELVAVRICRRCGLREDAS